MIDKSEIAKALSKVTDPGSGKDLVTAMLVSDLSVDGNNVNITLELPDASGNYKSDLSFAVMQTIQEVYPSAEVNVHTISRTPQATQETPEVLPQVRNIIAVASGKGGVGKSTVSVNLALALKRTGARVGIMDADLYGPSMPTMLGLQGQRPKVEQVGGQPKIIPLQAYGMPVISIGFIIEPEQAVVLRGPRLSSIIKQFVNDCVWPELDYLVVDLPPGTGDIQLTLVQTVPLTGVVMVTTPQEVAVVDAVKAMNMFFLPQVNVPILGVVENMSWFTPAELPENKYYLFGQGGGQKLARMANSVLLGQIPLVQGVREGGDTGKPIILEDAGNPAVDALTAAARELTRQVSLRHQTMGPTMRTRMDT
ncbi:MAG TPA: Mrp/NBP35 family ATP-binding protein [Flavilitoribacter sp.]|nr:Mrp/NBP35 family ATP-binding protein [Flavilitoribacter sp.]HMQ89676.1 Mrp/NBP35 family ATP-binding protein [Flavilitoribacter sp.]